MTLGVWTTACGRLAVVSPDGDDETGEQRDVDAGREDATSTRDSATPSGSQDGGPADDVTDAGVTDGGVAVNAHGCVVSTDTFDDDGDPTTPCVPRTTCAPGEYATGFGPNDGDRLCAACAPGFYSSGGVIDQCSWGGCAAGTVQVAPGSATAAATCEPCEAGTYCAGDTTPKVACASGTWDHDGNAGTSCIAWSVCQPGQYAQTSGGTATSNRVCTWCPDGTFSTTQNAASCTPWATTCEPGTYAIVRGSPTTDRSCAPCPPGQTTSTPNAGACFGPFKRLAATSAQTCAVLVDGTVRCWGQNGVRPLAGVATAIDVAPGGWQMCALLADGSVACSGSNECGSLGIGTVGGRSDVAVTVPGLTGVVGLGANDARTYAVRADGSLWLWGSWTWEDCAGPVTASPTIVTGIPASAQTAALWWSELVLGTDGRIREVHAISSNDDTVTRPPSLLPDITNAVKISGQDGGDSACAVIADGTVRCWGSNVQSASTVTVGGLDHVVDVSVGGNSACALLPGGAVKCWGRNMYGQLGDGTTTDSFTPVDVVAVSGATQIASGWDHSCALFPDGTARCWGRNDYGQLSDGTTTNSSTPVTVHW